jgi:hypothetical protein
MTDMVAATNPATPKSITTKHLAYELAEQHQLAESGLRAYKALSLGGLPKGGAVAVGPSHSVCQTDGLDR